MTRQIVLWIGCALLLGACSNVRLAYDHAETLVMLWADRYVDFTRDQETTARARLTPLLAWHRANQLPEYARFLQRVASRLDPYTGLGTPATAAEIMGLEEEARASVLVLTQRALPDLADLVLTLQPAQIERIDRRMTENIDKYRREAIGNEPGMRRRAERAIDRAEDWLGRLSRAQREQIRALAETALAPHALVLEQAQRRRRDLIGLLHQIQRDRPSREQVVTLLRAYAEGVAGIGTSEAAQQTRQIRAGNAALTAALINAATIEQRARAVVRIKEWADEFAGLAAARR